MGFVTIYGPWSHLIVNTWELERSGSSDRGQGQFLCGGTLKGLKIVYPSQKRFVGLREVFFFFFLVLKFSHTTVYSVQLEMANVAEGMGGTLSFFLWLL